MQFIYDSRVVKAIMSGSIATIILWVSIIYGVSESLLRGSDHELQKFRAIHWHIAITAARRQS